MKRNLLEQDDAGQFLSMRPARRWPDGRVEVVEQSLDGPAPPSSGDLPPDLETAARELILEAHRVAHAIEDDAPDIDWQTLCADLREKAEKLRHALNAGGYEDT